MGGGALTSAWRVSYFGSLRNWPSSRKSFGWIIACDSVQCARMCSVCRTSSLPSRWSLVRGWWQEVCCRSLEKVPAYIEWQAKTKNQEPKSRTSRLNSQKSLVLNWISHNPGLSLVFICVAHILGCIPRQRVFVSIKACLIVFFNISLFVLEVH